LFRKLHGARACEKGRSPVHRERRFGGPHRAGAVASPPRSCGDPVHSVGASAPPLCRQVQTNQRVV